MDQQNQNKPTDSATEPDVRDEDRDFSHEFQDFLSPEFDDFDYDDMPPSIYRDDLCEEDEDEEELAERIERSLATVLYCPHCNHLLHDCVCDVDCTDEPGIFEPFDPDQASLESLPTNLHVSGLEDYYDR